MPFILEFASTKRKKKTRNCSKGYNCGNSCINKSLKCKRKFSDQASTYAGWLKKNSNKTVSNSKNTRSKLNKMVDDASRKLEEPATKVLDKYLPRLDLMGAAQKALGDKYIQNTAMAERGAKAIAAIYDLPENYYAVVKSGYDNPNPKIIVNNTYISDQTERLEEQLSDRGLSIRVRNGLQRQLEASQQNDIAEARKIKESGLIKVGNFLIPETSKDISEQNSLDKSRLRNGRMQGDTKVGEVGTSGLGGRRRRRKK